MTNPYNWRICGRDLLIGGPPEWFIEERLPGGGGQLIADHIIDHATALLILEACRQFTGEGVIS